jgi:hypothetical protein
MLYVLRTLCPFCVSVRTVTNTVLGYQIVRPANVNNAHLKATRSHMIMSGKISIAYRSNVILICPTWSLRIIFRFPVHPQFWRAGRSGENYILISLIALNMGSFATRKHAKNIKSRPVCVKLRHTVYATFPVSFLQYYIDVSFKKSSLHGRLGDRIPGINFDSPWQMPIGHCRVFALTRHHHRPLGRARVLPSPSTSSVYAFSVV